MLAAYLQAHPLPAEPVPLKTLHREFIASIPAQDRMAWNVTRFAAECGAIGLRIGLRDRVNVVFPALSEAGN